MQKEINTLIAQYLTGKISEEDRHKLDLIRNGNKKVDETIRYIESLDDLPRRYREYSSVDKNKAMKKFLKRTGKKSFLYSWKMMVASIAAIVVLSLGIVYVKNTETSNVQMAEMVKVSDQVRNAMDISTKKGKNQSTTVALKNVRISGEEIEVSGNTNSRIAALVARLTHTPIENIDAKMDELLATTTIYDKEFWLTLSDGSLVHINNNTRVIYPEKFGSSRREIIIDGEAYFMVAKDSERPFIVHTPHGDVKVHGTEFFVSTGGHSTNVALVTGNISVSLHNGKEMRLVPGQEANLTDDAISVAAHDMSVYRAWNTGTFLFHDQSLDTILEVVSRWYNIDVNYSDTLLRNIRFTGSLDRYESVHVVLDAICDVTDIKWTMKNGEVIVSTKTE